MKKSYTKTGRACRVTFSLPSAIDAKRAALCGEFNDWSPDRHPMKLRRDGSFSVTVSLPTGRDYRFRYLLDGRAWENDWQADRYEANTFGTEDSVVAV